MPDAFYSFLLLSSWNFNKSRKSCVRNIHRTGWWVDKEEYGFSIKSCYMGVLGGWWMTENWLTQVDVETIVINLLYWNLKRSNWCSVQVGIYQHVEPSYTPCPCAKIFIYLYIYFKNLISLSVCLIRHTLSNLKINQPVFLRIWAKFSRNLNFMILLLVNIFILKYIHALAKASKTVKCHW